MSLAESYPFSRAATATIIIIIIIVIIERGKRYRRRVTKALPLDRATVAFREASERLRMRSAL